MVVSARKAVGAPSAYRQSLIDLVLATNPQRPWRTSGSLATQVKRWCVDSAQQSRQAYAGLNTASLSLVVGSTGRRRLDGIAIVPNTYPQEFRATVNRQLARGGLHLAQILNAIWP